MRLELCLEAALGSNPQDFERDNIEEAEKCIPIGRAPWNYQKLRKLK